MKESRTEKLVYILSVLLESWSIQTKIKWLQERMSTVNGAIKEINHYNYNDAKDLIDEAARETRQEKIVWEQIHNRNVFLGVLKLYEAELNSELHAIRDNTKYQNIIAHALVEKSQNNAFYNKWEPAFVNKQFKDLLQEILRQLREARLSCDSAKEKTDPNNVASRELAVNAIAYWYSSTKQPLTIHSIQRLNVDTCLASYREKLKEWYNVLLNKTDRILDDIINASDIRTKATEYTNELRQLKKGRQVEIFNLRNEFCKAVVGWQIIEEYNENETTPLTFKVQSQNNALAIVYSFLFPNYSYSEQSYPSQNELKEKLTQITRASEQFADAHKKSKASLQEAFNTFSEPERLSTHSNIQGESYAPSKSLWNQLWDWLRWGPTEPAIVEEDALNLGYIQSLQKNSDLPSSSPSISPSTSSETLNLPSGHPFDVQSYQHYQNKQGEASTSRK